MMSKPAISPAEAVPGARSRYDDFVAAHVNQTMTIHSTGNFLAWHRYFVHTWETALRDECGYSGYQPYWNWGKSALDPVNSPYMDGGPLSQGGNGVPAPHNCTRPIPDNDMCIPVGQGGGCVESGPYGKMIANISATGPTFSSSKDPVVVGEFFSYLPRCVRRDISPWVTSQWSTDNVSAHPRNPLSKAQTRTPPPSSRHVKAKASTEAIVSIKLGLCAESDEMASDYFSSKAFPLRHLI